MHSASELRVALLLCDDSDAADRAQFGDYATIFRRAFTAAGARLELLPYEVYRGKFPRADADVAGFLISGSRQAAYDATPWIIDLQEFVRCCHAARRKIAGICFGHQLIAHALGGETRKAAVGWGLGAHRARITAPQPWMRDAPAEYELIVLHQDQVVRLPPKFRVLARNDFCPISMYAGAGANGADTILGIQGHPELNADFCRARIESRRGQLSAEVYQNALASLDHANLDSARVLRWLEEFLRA